MQTLFSPAFAATEAGNLRLGAAGPVHGRRPHRRGWRRPPVVGTASEPAYPQRGRGHRVYHTELPTASGVPRLVPWEEVNLATAASGVVPFPTTGSDLGTHGDLGQYIGRSVPVGPPWEAPEHDSRSDRMVRGGSPIQGAVRARLSRGGSARTRHAGSFYRTSRFQ